MERIPRNLLKEQKGLSKEDLLNQEYQKAQAENQALLLKLEELNLVKSRMSNIIEICEINSHQNEKWLIGLNKLHANFEKMIAYEEDRLKSTRKAVKEAEELKKEFINQYSQLEEQKYKFSEYIDSTLANRKFIDSQIQNTDLMIQSVLVLEQRKQDKIVRAGIEKEELKRKQLERARQKAELAQEMLKVSAEYQKCTEIFNLNPEDPEHFEESPIFKDFLARMDTKESLEQQLIKNQALLNELSTKVKLITEEKNTFELALQQKGVPLVDEKKDHHDDSDETEMARNEKGIKNEVAVLEGRVEAAIRSLQKTKQTLSDFKNGVEDADLTNIRQKSEKNEIVESWNRVEQSVEVVENLVGKLRFVRGHLTTKQFQLLIEGKLDVKGWMAKVADEKKLYRQLSMSQHKTEENMLSSRIIQD